MAPGKKCRSFQINILKLFPISEMPVFFTIAFELRHFRNFAQKQNRAIGGVICCMREIGAVRAKDVENYHEEGLKKIAESLPQLTTLIDKFDIAADGQFIMNPGYENFQIIKEGEFLATYNNKKIYSKSNGRILMPLYQSKGEDGFFLIKDIIE